MKNVTKPILVTAIFALLASPLITSTVDERREWHDYDDEDKRKTLNAILRDEGYTADLALTADEAIQKTEETACNVAFMDIRLPDMEGIER